MDTRQSSPLLAYGVANGLLACGVNVLFAGVVSTPMIAYYSKIKNMIGVMITASHNPYTDNGIKVFNKGYKTTETDESLLEAFIDNPHMRIGDFGIFSYTDDVTEAYTQIYDNISLTQSTYKVLYDSANGANHLIAKQLMDRYTQVSCQVGNQPDGLNINLDCGSTHLDKLRNKVIQEDYDIAFSFDGDGDRIMTIDNKGNIYDGDMMIYIIASYMKSKNLLDHDTVVLTKMSNPGLLKALRQKGIHYHLTDVGDKYVFQALDVYGYVIGGEASGHIILKHLLHSGDGLLVAIYLLSILEELGTTLEALTKDVVIYPFKLTNLKGIAKDVLKKPKVIETIASLKQLHGDNVLILVRPSGTEQLIRVTVSAEDEALMNDISNDIIEVIQKEGDQI